MLLQMPARWRDPKEELVQHQSQHQSLRVQVLLNAYSTVRGQTSLPEGALVLRIARTTAVEQHHGKELRRILMQCTDIEALRLWVNASTHPEWPPLPVDAISTGESKGAAGTEVEVELVLWDEELRMCPLLPEGAPKHATCASAPITKGTAYRLYWHRYAGVRVQPKLAYARLSR